MKKKGTSLPRGMRWKGDSIEYRFYVPVIGGGTKRVSVTGGTVTACRHEEQLVRRKGAVAAEEIDLNELLDRYVEERERKRKDRRATDYIARAFRLHVRPALGTYKLHTLCEHWKLIADAFDELHDDSKGGAARQKCFDELKRAFTYAVRQQLIPFNPAQNVDRPKYEAPVTDPLSAEEI